LFLENQVSKSYCLIFLYFHDDRSCKHVAAVLFGHLAFCMELEDRSDITVTDQAAYWTVPKRVCRPVSVDDIDIR